MIGQIRGVRDVRGVDAEPLAELLLQVPAGDDHQCRAAAQPAVEVALAQAAGQTVSAHRRPLVPVANDASRLPHSAANVLAAGLSTWTKSGLRVRQRASAAKTWPRPATVVCEDDLGAGIDAEILAIVVNVINGVGDVDAAGDHLPPQLAQAAPCWRCPPTSRC